MIKAVDITIWGRDYVIPVEYDCYTAESVTKEQIIALNRFISHKEWLDDSKKALEDYCQEQVMKDDTVCQKHNVFNYVVPRLIFVKRNKKHGMIALMCDYKYDPEHGLALLFSSNGKTIIGSQDSVL